MNRFFHRTQRACALLMAIITLAIFAVPASAFDDLSEVVNVTDYGNTETMDTPETPPSDISEATEEEPDADLSDPQQPDADAGETKEPSPVQTGPGILPPISANGLILALVQAPPTIPV